MKYQTDYDGDMRKYGCLLCCLVSIVEESCACEMSNDNFLAFLADMQKNDQVGDKIFIRNHNAVLTGAALRLGIQPKIRYTGCIYMPWEERQSWGRRNGDYIILHIRTPNGEHFRLPNHDPWRPGTKMVDLLSLRYYSVA